jgi:hypothetical protein
MIGRREVGLSLLTAVALLGGCSSSATDASTATTHGPPSGSSNVTPCNYAGVWRDDPSHFSEFQTVVRFARTAANSDLRSEAEQLASAVGGANPNAISDAMSGLVTTCEELGLVRSPSTGSTTTG